MENNWCLFTYSKNYFDNIEAFINFYHKYWGISKFFFAIGYSDQTFLASLQEKISGIFAAFNREIALDSDPNLPMKHAHLFLSEEDKKKTFTDSFDIQNRFIHQPRYI